MDRRIKKKEQETRMSQRFQARDDIFQPHVTSKQKIEFNKLADEGLVLLSNSGAGDKKTETETRVQIINGRNVMITLGVVLLVSMLLLFLVKPKNSNVDKLLTLLCSICMVAAVVLSPYWARGIGFMVIFGNRSSQNRKVSET